VSASRPSTILSSLRCCSTAAAGVTVTRRRHHRRHRLSRSLARAGLARPTDGHGSTAKLCTVSCHHGRTRRLLAACVCVAIGTPVSLQANGWPPARPHLDQDPCCRRRRRRPWPALDAIHTYSQPRIHLRPRLLQRLVGVCRLLSCWLLGEGGAATFWRWLLSGADATTTTPHARTRRPLRQRIALHPSVRWGEKSR